MNGPNGGSRRLVAGAQELLLRNDLGKAQAITLSLQHDFIAEPGIATVIAAFLRYRIRWGTEGNSQEVLVDGKRGTMLTIVGSGFSVMAEYGNPGDAGPDVIASASWSQGWLPHDAPTCTIFRGTVANAAESARTRIPRFVSSLLAYKNAATAPTNCTLRFFTELVPATGPHKIIGIGTATDSDHPLRAVQENDNYVSVANGSTAPLIISVVGVLAL